MARRDAPLIALGVGVLVVIAVGVYVVTIFGDTETDIVLRNPPSATSPCSITGKETEVTVKNGKSVTWKIKNKCANKDEVITIGNFRTSPESDRADCEAPTEGTVTWPFKEDQAVENRRDTSKIKLKLNKIPDLSTPVIYYFDVCSATGGKADPRLVIEP